MRSLIEFWVRNIQNQKNNFDGVVLSSEFVEKICGDLSFSNNLQHYYYSTDQADYIREISFYRDFLKEDEISNDSTFFDYIDLNEPLAKSLVDSISNENGFYENKFMPALKKYKVRSNFWNGSDRDRDDFLIEHNYIPKHLGPDFPEINHEPDFKERLEKIKISGKVYKNVAIKNPLTGEIENITLEKTDKMTKAEWDRIKAEMDGGEEDEVVKKTEPYHRKFNLATDGIWKRGEFDHKRIDYLKNYSNQDDNFTVEEFQKFRTYRYDSDLQYVHNTLHGKMVYRIPEIIDESRIGDKWITTKTGRKFKVTQYHREKDFSDKRVLLNHLEHEEFYQKTGRMHPEKIPLIPKKKPEVRKNVKVTRITKEE